jgi:hypothetical protein
MTAIFHRRFYPDDVAGTIAYVAPITLGREDHRYLEFFEQVASPSCRDQIHGVQRSALVRRSDIIALYQATHVEPEFGIIGGIAGAYESTVVHMEWQAASSTSCPVTGEVLSDEELLELLLTFGFGSGYTDEQLTSYGPYYYQVENQLSGGITPTDHLTDLLENAESGYFERLFPGVPKPSFDPMAMQGILDWIHEDAEQMIFVYGSRDPFTAARVGIDNSDESRDLHELLVSEGGHGSSLRHLPTGERELACFWITNWSGSSSSSCNLVLDVLASTRVSLQATAPPFLAP